MSSNLSSLKKPHKTPLYTGFGEKSEEENQKQKEQNKTNKYRHNRSVPFKAPHYSDDESKLLDEITGGMATHRMKARDPFAGGLPKLDTTRGLMGSSPKGGDNLRCNSRLSMDGDYDSLDIPSDHELMSTMMTRITQLESKLAYQSKEMAEKDKKIRVLEEKVKLLKKSQDYQYEPPEGQNPELEKKCLLLQQQVHEMETFLADYGMVWVGEKVNPDSAVYNEDGEDSEEEMWRPASSLSQRGDGYQVDYNKMIENIQELNVLAGEGVAQVKFTNDGARLKMPDPVSLSLFANGIMLYSGPFRSFTDISTQQFVQDIVDGYFPSELQSRYPDGVPFEVADRRNIYFKDEKKKVFAGSGQVLGGETKPSRLVPTNLDKNTNVTEEEIDPSLEVTSQLPGPQLTLEQFLQKLPKSVVKEGKLIDIRDSVGNTFQGAAKGSSGVTVVETETVKDMKKRLEGGDDKSHPFTPRDITTLRIKSEGGDHTYIMKMKFMETIGDLRKYLTLQRPRDAPPFDILTAYPNKVYPDDSATLYDSGLTPNAVLHLRLKKS